MGSVGTQCRNPPLARKRPHTWPTVRIRSQVSFTQQPSSFYSAPCFLPRLQAPGPFPGGRGSACTPNLSSTHAGWLLPPRESTKRRQSPPRLKMRLFLLCLTVRAIKLLLLMFPFPVDTPGARVPNELGMTWRANLCPRRFLLSTWQHAARRVSSCCPCEHNHT